MHQIYSFLVNDVFQAIKYIILVVFKSKSLPHMKIQETSHENTNLKVIF